MGKFEVSAAYAMGIILPVLEVARRRTNFDDVPAYIDDLIIGALLLWAARAASRRHPLGPGLLVAAWGLLCGGLWSSFFGQLSNPDSTDVSGLPHDVVVLVKAVVYVIALAALFRSIRGVAAEGARHAGAA